MFKVNNGPSAKLVSGNFPFTDNHYTFRQKSETKLKASYVDTETAFAH